jgi:hypothetical protein
MTAVFCDCEGVILGNVVIGGETVSSNAYISALKKLMEAFQTISPHKNPAELLLQHDSARPHASYKTWNAIMYCSWTVLHHSPCSSDLTPSAFFRAPNSPEGGYPLHEV